LGDRVRGSAGGATVAEGRAELAQGEDLKLQADRISYDPAGDRAVASGRVRIERDGDLFSGRELDVVLGRFEGQFTEPTFFFAGVGAGGRADKAEFRGAQRSLITGAVYSSCDSDRPGGPDWQLEARSLDLDFEANLGLARDARLRFLGVPILAVPVLSFPVTDERKSGWLPPTLDLTNRSGVVVAVPYYWNIAPNRDATLTPIVYARRGLGLDSEWRYLDPAYAGTWQAHVLPSDRQSSGRSRWGVSASHDSAPELPWQWHGLVKRTSDDTYWKDFPHSVTNLMPRLLPLDLQTSHAQTWGEGESSLYARVQRWQVLQDTDPTLRITAPYERVPQLGWRGRSGASGLEWAWETEVNRFSLPAGEDDGTRPTGLRLHLLGQAAWPLRTPGWSLVPRLGLNAASYETDQLLATGRQQVSRVIPTFSVDSVWVLEREASWRGQRYLQTLEPRLYYVNTPYRAQAVVPNFDAAGKDFNFESLYTDNAFSGVDRVSDAHQVTAGATTRLLDPQDGGERLRLGVAQRYLLRDQRVTPDGIPFTRRFSDVLLLGSTTLLPRWTLDAAVQYSPEIERVRRSVLSARYSPGPFRTVSASYRFARDATEQIEMAWQWPLSGPLPPLDAQGRRVSPVEQVRLRGSRGDCAGTWYGVGRVNYSLRASRITDSVVGFEYDAGCWIGRVVAERLSTGRTEATNRLHLQLELVGLSRLGTNPLRVLKENIPGYRLLRDDETETALR
jgi:LPS-assembly protein